MKEPCQCGPCLRGYYTLKEIGKVLRVSPERVRVIEMRALKKLRNALELIGVDADSSPSYGVADPSAWSRMNESSTDERAES